MANTILDLIGTRATFTCTLGALASSTAGVGRQTTRIDNSTTRAPRALVFVKVTVGTSPTANKSIYVYLWRYDGTNSDDNAGASDAAHTVVNTPLLGVINVPATTSDTAYYGVFDTGPLGPLGTGWGLTIVHDTGVNLNATGGNHVLAYQTVIPEVQ